MNDEKRTSERVPVNLRTRWHGATGSHEGRVEDLSVTGCFVNTTGAVDEGEIVSLLIQLPSGRWLPIRGKVAFYQQLTGFSISFSILDDKERETLNELVAQQSATT
jgi:PilZ domain